MFKFKKNNTVLKRSDLLRIQADFLDSLAIGLYQDKKHQFIKYQFNAKFTTISHFNDDEYQFDCEFIIVDIKGCHLYGYHHGYEHKVYLSPDEINEII